MMTPWDAPVVQQLLADERVALSGFPHADAFVALPGSFRNCRVSTAHPAVKQKPSSRRVSAKAWTSK
jgi:hypothetical protein